MNILVSGVAGDIGFGIARILKDWGIFSKLHGIDLHADHPGPFVLDKCAVAPRANEKHYLNWLADYIDANHIDVFIPSSEAELNALVTAKISEIAGAKIIKCSDFCIQKSLDKFQCLSYLAENAIPVPNNGLVGHSEPTSYPVIVKPRSGQGSKGITLVRDDEEFTRCKQGDVWQTYLSTEDEEYTCAVYASPKTAMRVLLIKRKLAGGLTGTGMVVQNPEIEGYVRSIGEIMRADGPINIQLRLTENGPLLFEINPRLSSTLVFRDKIGFSDLRWWLADQLNLESPPYTVPEVGTRFYRGAQEYIFTSDKGVL